MLSSPGLDDNLPGWKHSLAKVLGRVAPTLDIPNGIDGSTLSRDPSVAAKTVDDPGCVTTSTTRMGAAAFAEQARVRAEAHDGLGVPTLVQHGEDDGLVPVDASASFEGAPLTTRDDPGAPPRAPQRAGGTRGHRRRHRLAPGAGGGPCYADGLIEYASGERLER